MRLRYGQFTFFNNEKVGSLKYCFMSFHRGYFHSSTKISDRFTLRNLVIKLSNPTLFCLIDVFFQKILFGEKIRDHVIHGFNCIFWYVDEKRNPKNRLFENERWKNEAT